MTDEKVAPEAAAPEKTASPKTDKADKATKMPKSDKTEKKTSAKTEAPKKKVKYVNPFSYNDPLQSKFVNCIMKNGKKRVAERILKDTFDEMNRRGEDDPMKTFEKAYANATPTMEVKPKRIGGGIYQIPMEVPAKRQQSLAIRWILAGARKRKGMPMSKRLALELLDSATETGFAYGKREDAHRMAAANKAFAHLARY